MLPSSSLLLELSEPTRLLTDGVLAALRTAAGRLLLTGGVLVLRPLLPGPRAALDGAPGVGLRPPGGGRPLPLLSLRACRASRLRCEEGPMTVLSNLQLTGAKGGWRKQRTGNTQQSRQINQKGGLTHSRALSH